jgi:hypothetical protein
MSPFGKKTESQDTDDAASSAELARLNALALRELAAEVMSKGFGPTGPASDGLPTPSMISEVFVPNAARVLPTDQFQALQDIIWEGVQVLEHASLVRFAVYSSEGGKFFKLTRLGRSTLDQDAVGRVLAGGSA